MSPRLGRALRGPAVGSAIAPAARRRRACGGSPAGEPPTAGGPVPARRPGCPRNRRCPSALPRIHRIHFQLRPNPHGRSPATSRNRCGGSEEGPAGLRERLRPHLRRASRLTGGLGGTGPGTDGAGGGAPASGRTLSAAAREDRYRSRPGNRCTSPHIAARPAAGTSMAQLHRRSATPSVGPLRAEIVFVAHAKEESAGGAVEAGLAGGISGLVFPIIFVVNCREMASPDFPALAPTALPRTRITLIYSVPRPTNGWGSSGADAWS